MLKHFPNFLSSVILSSAIFLIFLQNPKFLWSLFPPATLFHDSICHFYLVLPFYLHSFVFNAPWLVPFAALWLPPLLGASSPSPPPSQSPSPLFLLYLLLRLLLFILHLLPLLFRLFFVYFFVFVFVLFFVFFFFFVFFIFIFFFVCLFLFFFFVIQNPKFLWSLFPCPILFNDSIYQSYSVFYIILIQIFSNFLCSLPLHSLLHLTPECKVALMHISSSNFISWLHLPLSFSPTLLPLLPSLLHSFVIDHPWLFYSPPSSSFLKLSILLIIISSSNFISWFHPSSPLTVQEVDDIHFLHFSRGLSSPSFCRKFIFLSSFPIWVYFCLLLKFYLHTLPWVLVSWLF